MSESTAAATTVAKDVAVIVAKELAITVTGVVIATGLVAVSTSIVTKVKAHRPFAKKSTKH